MTQSTPPMQGAQVEFPAGTVIFKEGDPGGDLYFVREGEVEVFKESSGIDVHLASLKTGEILGVMTCMTREPRLASARAKTDVKLLVVKQAGIRSLITGTPAWVNTVIKDFILRIKQMDDLYARAVSQLEMMGGTDDSLQMGVNLASGIAEVGRLLIGKESSTVVDINKACEHLSKILDVPATILEQIFDVFIEVGLLKGSSENKLRRAELPVLVRLGTFATFGRELIRTPEVKRAYDSLTAKNCQYLVQAADKARQVNGSAPDKPLLVEIAAIVPEGTTLELMTDLFERLAPTQVCSFIGDDHTKVGFTPMTLNNNARSVVAMQKIRALDSQRLAAKNMDHHHAKILTENF